MTRFCKQPTVEDAPITLRADLHFFPLDEDLVAFCETSQTLVGLNSTAASVIQKLREGISDAHLAECLVERGITSEDARSWVSATRDALGSQGLLAGTKPPKAPMEEPTPDARQEIEKARIPPYALLPSAAEGRYRLLGTVALVRYGHLSQQRMVESIIGHLACDNTDSPTVEIDVQSEFWTTSWNVGQIASNIYVDGKPEARAVRLSSVGPMVKSALWTIAVNAHDFLLDLHAGVVGNGERCILLPAAPGSGKSSLTSALVHSGLRYYSDEVALVERESFQVSPVPLAICVKSTGWDLMSRFYPQIPELPVHRRGDDKQVRYVSPPAGSVQKLPARVSHIFFPRYSGDEPTRLNRLSRADAIARLMDQCLAFRLHLDQAGVGELVSWIRGIDCYALTFSSLDEAVALVRDTAFSR